MSKTELVFQKAETFEVPAIIAHHGPDQGHRKDRHK